MRRAENLRTLRFVGGHPMAGGQLSGVANASSNLFEGARYFLTPTGSTDRRTTAKSPGSSRAGRYPYRRRPGEARPTDGSAHLPSWRRS